ncbi:MAG TPA: tetratricopeptide repeat protein [Kiritimatiellia bacterium]|nr:tetratricopeptide repeat protein [Kiritimatiellia bacterium]HMP33237.1 tetratricopeptide repeat protein [Kiritimatiellia bacterium]
MNDNRNHAGKIASPLIACSLLALAVRMTAWWLLQSSVMLTPPSGGGHDRSLYVAAMERVADGVWWPDGSFDYLPLYPWLGGLATRLTGNPVAAAAALGIALDTLTTALILLFALRLGAPRNLAALAACLYAAYPLATIYSLQPMPNTLNAFGITVFAGLIHAQWTATRPRPIVTALTGLFGGVFALGFAGLLPMAAAAAAALAWRHRSILPALALLAGFALPLTPVAVHNTRAEGRLTLLSTHGGLNLYMGNHRDATGYPLRIRDFRMTARDLLADAHRHAEQQAGRTLTRAESSAWWSGQARTFWREEPALGVYLTARKLLLFWNHREMDDLRLLEQIRLTDPAFRAWHGTPFAVFAWAGLIGLLYARNAAAPRLLVLTGLIGLVLFFITARYRLTFVPLLSVLGAAGLPVWWAHVTARRWRHLATGALCAAVVAVPFKVRDQRPIDHYNAAIMLSQAGRQEEAGAVIEQGLVLAPGFGELYFALGNVLFQQEHFLEAASSFERALALNPNQPTAGFNLVLSLAKAGEVCAARDAAATIAGMGLAVDARLDGLRRELDAACPR